MSHKNELEPKTDQGEAVDVVEILGGCERVPLLGRCGSAPAVGDVRDCDCARDKIVDVGNRAGGDACRRFRRAEGVGLRGAGLECVADIGLRERVV